MRLRATFLSMLSLGLATSAALVATPADAVPVWTPVRTLDAAGDHPAIASNANGDAVAAWVDRDAGGPQVWSATYSRFSSGWSVQRVRTLPGFSVGTPAVAIDAAGRTTVGWVQTDTTGPNDGFYPGSVQVTTHSGGAWPAPTTLGDANGSMDHALSLAVDGSGTVTAAFASADGSSCTPLPCTSTGDSIRYSSHPVDGAWSAAAVAVTGGFSGAPDLAVDSAGALDLVATSATGAATDRTVVHTHKPASGSWAAPTTLSTTGATASGYPQVAVDGTDNPTAAWGECDSTDCRVVGATGPLLATRTTLQEAAAPSTASDTTLALAPAASTTTVVWRLPSGARVLAARHAVAGWEASNALYVVPAGTGAAVTGAAGNGAGDTVAAWSTSTSSGNGSVVAHRPAGGAWGASTLLATNAPGGGVTRPMSTVTAALSNGRFGALLTPTGQGVASTERVDDTTPPRAGMLAPGPRYQTSTSFPISWAGSDSQAGLASYDVRSRAATWRSVFGSYGAVRTGTTAEDATYKGYQGRTYCFQVRATDRAGLVSGWSAEHCTSTPVDDRATRVSSGWKRTRSSGSYAGTETTTSKHGKRISLVGAHGKRYWLVATTTRNGGSVRATLGGKTIKNVSLRSRTTKHKQVFWLGTFSKVRTDKLVLTVTSASGRTVRVDGITVGR